MSPTSVIPIDDLADPRLADYADQKESSRRAHAHGGTGLPPGLFIAEGELVVRHLIASPYHIRSILLTPTRLETIRDALERVPPGTTVYLVSQQVMNAVVGFNIHRGILAAADQGEPLRAESLLHEAHVVVILEDLVNHDNIGGIFRSTAALAGPRSAILLSPRCADPMYRKAIRVSMGHVLRIPFATLRPWPEAIAQVKTAGFQVIALTPDAGAMDIGEVAARLNTAETRPRIALLIGTEGAGLTNAALAAADIRARIPMTPGVDSLNATTAAAIALHRLAGNPEST